MVAGFYYRGGVLFKAEVGVKGNVGSFRVVEERKILPAMFFEDRGVRFLRFVGEPIKLLSDSCGLS